MTTIATECPVCPKGIVACAHLDGRVVWLVDEYLYPDHEGYISTWRGERWNVHGPDTPEQCVCSTDHVTMPTPWYKGNSLADAEAEYELRCALLRAEA